MKTKFSFTFVNIEKCFKEALDNGYQVLTCSEYIKNKEKYKSIKVLINRVDIDVSPKKAKRLVAIFNNLNVKATFFVRLHANEYNPFSFENYPVLKYIKESGHEIGYHSEIIDESMIWNEEVKECLIRDIAVLSKLLNVRIQGVASHNGMTGQNNLDFWESNKPSDFGLLYEAYIGNSKVSLFNESFFVSDSNWTYWKCYDKGLIIDGDHRSLGEHTKCGHQTIYSLIHPETYCDEQIHE